MCKNVKKFRQSLQLASSILGLLAAIIYYFEVRKEIDSEV